jgi:hypothetical protein
VISIFENHNRLCPKLLILHYSDKLLGLEGAARGRSAASIGATGSSMGSIGLFVFAWVVWQFMPSDHAWVVLAGATLSWLTVSVVVWQIRKRT